MQETGEAPSFDEDECPVSRTLGAEPLSNRRNERNTRTREREGERKGKRVGRSKERAWRVKFIHKKENYYARGEATPAK